MMHAPENHALRVALNDEAHARPSESLQAPLRLTYLALVHEAADRDPGWLHVAGLAARYGVKPPPQGTNHYSANLGPFRIKCERHTEFTRYKFIVPGPGSHPFLDPAIAAVPREWFAALPGRTMVATHAALLPAGATAPDFEALATEYFDGQPLVGAGIAGGLATAVTDFRIHADGYGRLLVQNRGMPPRQAGRMVQRLLEIDTYRLMSLLALPVAQQLGPFLARSEAELAEVMALLAGTGEMDEPGLLDRLTKLQADMESRESASHYRFDAATAYYDLVRRRIVELRETRIPGLQNLEEFTDRRLAPAMSTCRAVASRQSSLSQRAARATQLLSTRVDVSRERQNQAVLASMDRRAAAQLRLQQTVEGLSVAAITYYLVGLVAYAAKGLQSAGVALDPEVVTAVSIPFVAVLIALGVRAVRRSVETAYTDRR